VPEGHFDGDEPLTIPVSPGGIGKPFDCAIVLARRKHSGGLAHFYVIGTSHHDAAQHPFQPTRRYQGDFGTWKALWEFPRKGRYLVVESCISDDVVSTQIERESLKDVFQVEDTITAAFQHLYPII
jgi:hypothetical protein